MRILSPVFLLFLSCLDAVAGDAWLYQLQNPDPAAIARARFHHAVLDYSRDGTDAGALSAAELKALGQAGVETLCYLSIGEAESYRFYWQKEWKTSPPAWLGRENPDWKGNYEVRYWVPEWREKFLRPYLKRIVDQGFSGVYLDIVDGFEYWGDPDTYKHRETRRPDDPADEADAAARMLDLLRWIRETGRELAGKERPFLVFAQNGERLLEFGPLLTFIDGCGVESLWWEGKKRLAPDNTNPRLALLRRIRDAGKRVLITDYIDDGSGYTGTNKLRMDEFLRLCSAEKFDHYIARKDRALDKLNRIEPVQP